MVVLFGGRVLSREFIFRELEEKDKLSVENEYKDQLLSQKLASLKEEIENQK